MDLHLQQYVRHAASRGRDTERIGPFLATFDPHNDNPYLSYAIPDDGAQPTADDVAALIAAYERRDRVPRLEYLPAVAPEAEAALLDGGLTVEARLPVMTCTPGHVVDLGSPPGIALAVPATDEELLAMAAAQMAAFGEPPPDPAGVTRTRAALQDGMLAILARDDASGAVVGGGVATAPGDGVTEVAGIGVVASFRRRGIAGAITARLTRDGFAAGVRTAFITPGHDGAQSVYARAGFADTSVILHVRRP